MESADTIAICCSLSCISLGHSGKVLALNIMNWSGGTNACVELEQGMTGNLQGDLNLGGKVDRGD